MAFTFKLEQEEGTPAAPAHAPYCYPEVEPWRHDLAWAMAMLVLVAALAAGCLPDGGSTSQSQSFPAAGTEAWGTDNCLYTSSGFSWLKGLWCRKVINGTLTDYYFANTIKYRVDESDAKYYQEYDYQLDRWYAQDRETKVVYVKTADGRLLTPYAYWKEQAQPQQGTTTPGPPPSTATPAGSTGTVPNTQGTIPYWQVQQHIDEVRARMVDRILAPACVSSYNGCR
jgi:hypothetical protein